jgi:hypothetical protein
MRRWERAAGRRMENNNAPAYANKEKTSSSSAARTKDANFAQFQSGIIVFFPKGVSLAPLLDTF